MLLPLQAAQAMSMAMHELAANAAKYGALSVASGRVDVVWRINGNNVSLIWRDTGGSRLYGPPDRSSFDSILIRSAVENQVGGTVVKRWETGGLACEVNLILTLPTLQPSVDQLQGPANSVPALN